MKVDKSIEKQYDTVCAIEQAMRGKVEEQIPHFQNMNVVQLVTSTQGEKVLKANPAMQEIRALFRDYAAIVKVQQDIVKNNPAPVEVSSLENFRSRLKAAK
jgi:hypothetical protein